MSPFQPGDLLGGRYRLARVMGVGATGVVWSARDEATERDLAIKLMLPEAARDPRWLRRFFEEAKVARRLRHPCIVEVYDLGLVDHGPRAGSPYLVMELLDGEPLDRLLRRVGRLPAGTALRIVRDVARGLRVAHEQGVLHRDLKPANVFLHRAPDGETIPKILDFGISKLVARDELVTGVGKILGSPAYMSPEQTAGEDLDPRADLWSLGVVLYKALTGTLPFPAASHRQLMHAINTQDPLPLEERAPGLPEEVRAIVRRCLSRRRAGRFPSAAALADAIDAVLETHDLPVIEPERCPREPLDVASTAKARPALTAEGTGAHAIGLSREAVSVPEPTSRAREMRILIALAVTATVVSLLLRARIEDRPVAPPAAAAAAPDDGDGASTASSVGATPSVPSSSASSSSSVSGAAPAEPAPRHGSKPAR